MSRAKRLGALVAVWLAGGAAVAHGWRAVAPLSFHTGLLVCAAGLGLLAVGCGNTLNPSCSQASLNSVGP